MADRHKLDVIAKAGPVVLKDVKPWMIVIENTARD